MDEDQMKGLLSEERFLKLMEGGSVEWYCGCRRAPRHFDDDGFDAFIYIRRIDCAELVEVPVQIKSSERGRDRHYAKYPDHWRWRVFVAVVNETKTDEEIRHEVFAHLNHVRSGRYDYVDLLSITAERWMRVARARMRLQERYFRISPTYLSKAE